MVENMLGCGFWRRAWTRRGQWSGGGEVVRSGMYSYGAHRAVFGKFRLCVLTGINAESLDKTPHYFP